MLSEKRGAYMENQALKGVKVLDFGWALVGALTGRYLGDHGADVVRVESSKRPDFSRIDKGYPGPKHSAANDLDDKPWFAQLNVSKYSMALNLKHPRAKEVVERLVRWADVVNENYTPGTMDKLGFGYEHLKTLNPGIIMVSGSVYGQTGRLASEWGIDGTGVALSGRLALTGWPDRAPVTPSSGIYGDYVLPIINTLAVVAALIRKRKTGKGEYIDASMFEVCSQQVSPALLDWQVNGRTQTRTGNRIPNAAPHGIFPCTGEDRWCAVSVFTSEEWESFKQVLGNPTWTKEQRFSTLELRKENEDELEQLVSEWTSKHAAEEVMRNMQRAGIASGVVQDGQDILEKDPHLAERGLLTQLTHPVLGTFGHQATPFRLSKTPSKLRAAPCLGEHSEFVCTNFLGMTDEEFVDLAGEGVFE
jgi:benzylsuccinate CoA-transferase BbsF subunit